MKYRIVLGKKTVEVFEFTVEAEDMLEAEAFALSFDTSSEAPGSERVDIDYEIGPA